MAEWQHIRKFDRAKHGENAAFKPSKGGLKEGVIRDVGEGGLFITSSISISIGTRMTVYLPLQLQKKKTLCMLSGAVVRLSGSNEPRGFGIQFDPSLPPATRETLRAFVNYKSSVLGSPGYV